jgi:hypothetical protein
LSANTYTPATGKLTVLAPRIGSGWSTGNPLGNDAGLSSPQLPAARLSGVQGKIAEVNVAPNVVVWNSTDPPTGTTVTDGSNHFPGTSVTCTTAAAGSAWEAIRGSDDTTSPSASSPTRTFHGIASASPSMLLRCPDRWKKAAWGPSRRPISVRTPSELTALHGSGPAVSPPAGRGPRVEPAAATLHPKTLDANRPVTCDSCYRP